METFQTLATESFSYNWLVNKSLPSSLMCLTSSSQDFDFDIVLPTSSYTLVDAGDIFFHGEIVPSFANQNSKAYSYPSTPFIYMQSSTTKSPKYPKNFTALRRWRNSFKKILKRCFCILSSESSHEKPEDGSPQEFGTKNTSMDVEDSILEAISYCRRYEYCKDLKKMVKTGQTRTRERNREYKSRENAIKVNSSGKRTPWQSYTSPNAPIGGNPKGNDTRTMKETHQGLDFCTKRRTKEAQEGHITDCHTSNPCAHQNDPRAKNEDPMISIHQGCGLRGASN
ncbi:hypothetical protein Tco_1175393 [Tanacetum coccineum]